MTKSFDNFCESIIREYLTAKAKRKESRYWNNNVYPDMTIRKVRTSDGSISDSQKTKILNQQQYVGDYWEPGGVRIKNKSEKDFNNASIARGIGGRLRINRKPGSKVNSKQGNMEVKYTLPNGISKIGPTGKTQYRPVKKIFNKEDK
jgi:hypothetical protein